MAAFDTQSGLTGVMTRTVGAVTPAAAYSAWATEIGVSPSVSLYALDGDDNAFEIDLAAPALGTTNTTAFFSAEGALGLYNKAPTVRSSSVIAPWFDVTKVSRMSSFPIRPTVFMTFHPQQDNKSVGIKLQRSGTTTIITGRIQSYSSALAAIDFAIRLDGGSAWKVILSAVDQPINFFLFGVVLIDEKISETVAPGTIANFDFTSLVYVPTTLIGQLTQIGQSPSYAFDSVYTGTRFVGPQYGAKDFNYGGKGVISGTVKLDGTPTDVPVSRRVRLYRDQDGSLVREQWSVASTGAYSFPGIQEGIAYTVVSYDHTHNFRAVIADNIIPDLMP